MPNGLRSCALAVRVTTYKEGEEEEAEIRHAVAADLTVAFGFCDADMKGKVAEGLWKEGKKEGGF